MTPINCYSYIFQKNKSFKFLSFEQQYVVIIAMQFFL